MSNDFWSWSLELYGRQGVAEALIDVQDMHGLDVNLILFCLWQAAQGCAMPPDMLDRAVALSEGWTRPVIVPIRAARRALKTAKLGTEEARQTQRRLLQDIEIELERLYQAALSEIAGSDRAPEADNPMSTGFAQLARTNLRRYFAALRWPEDRSTPLLTSQALDLVLRRAASN